MILKYRDQLINVSIYVALLVSIVRSFSFWWSSTSIIQSPNDVAQIVLTQATVSDAFRLMGAFLLLWCIKAECHYMWLRRNMPPSNALGYSFPVIGHFYHLTTKPAREYLVECIVKNNHQPFVMNMLMMPSVCYFSVEDTMWAYTQEGKGKMGPVSVKHLAHLIGEESVIAQCGEQHKRLRKIMNSSFTSAAVKDYLPVMDAVVKKSLASWYERTTTSQTVDSSNENNDTEKNENESGWQTLQSVQDVSLEILFRSAFPDIDRSDLHELQRDVREWVLGFAALVPLRIPGLTYHTACLAQERFYDRVKGLLDEFRSKHSPQDEDMNKKGAGSLMGRFCYSTDDEGNPLKDVELIENFSLLVIAGDDTTSGSIGSLLYHWDRLDPVLQQSLRDEANSLPAELEYEQLQTELPLINAFLAELWRLETPGHFHQTTVVQPVKRDGYTIPPGSGINILLASGHFDDERYPNRTEFDLKRFLPRDHPLVVQDPSTCCTGDINANSLNSKYRIFNNGMHSCIGHLFAKLQVRLFMIRFLQSYNVELRNIHRVEFILASWSHEFQITKRSNN